MYASRAKRIRNVSVVNCDAWRAGEQPQSGLGQVSADLLGLEQRLAARTQEFDRLKDLRSNDQVRWHQDARFPFPNFILFGGLFSALDVSFLT